jgi:diguanylate cyclase (GGDEF)-like protein
MVVLGASIFVALAIAACAFERRARIAIAHAVALERALAARLEAMQSMLEASRRSAREVLEALDAALRATQPAVDVLLIFEPELHELRCTFARGQRAEHYLELRLRRDDGQSLPAAAAAERRQLALTFALRPIVPTDRDAIAVPLGSSGVLQAIAYVSTAGPSLGRRAELIALVEAAAAPYALACDRERDRRSATYDALTGLLTPRAFRARLQEEMVRARGRAGEDITVWFIDTDEFKRVNDTLGHATGDAVLQQMAGLLRAHAVDGLDVVARNGGDEFCALIRGVPKTLAIERAQAFCESVRTHDFGIGARISASVGVASYPSDASSSSALLEMADAAMYHSKRAGRDRVSFAVAPGRFAVYS